MTQNALYILDDSPWFEWTELEATDSTNNFLKDYRPASPKTFTLVTAEYQQHGRGQVGNHWVARTCCSALRYALPASRPTGSSCSHSSWPWP